MKYNTGGTEYRLKNKLLISTQSDCWEWSGPKSPEGYGLIGINRTRMRVHRLAYKLWVSSELPQYAIVEQICGNRLCCNPAHLYVDENSLQYPANNARKRGELHHKTTVTAAQVREMREYYRKKEKTQMQLAKMYNITQVTASRILKNKTWRHV